jgi:hypothetical protein
VSPTSSGSEEFKTSKSRPSSLQLIVGKLKAAKCIEIDQSGGLMYLYKEVKNAFFTHRQEITILYITIWGCVTNLI